MRLDVDGVEGLGASRERCFAAQNATKHSSATNTNTNSIGERAGFSATREIGLMMIAGGDYCRGRLLPGVIIAGSNGHTASSERV